MSDDKANFVLRLIDKVSRPGERVAAVLERVAGAARKAARGIERVTAAMDLAGKSAAALGGAATAAKLTRLATATARVGRASERARRAITAAAGQAAVGNAYPVIARTFRRAGPRWNPSGTIGDAPALATPVNPVPKVARTFRRPAARWNPSGSVGDAPPLPAPRKVPTATHRAYREFFALNDQARMSMLRARAQMNRFVDKPTLAGFLKLNRLAGESASEFGNLFAVFRRTPMGFLIGGIGSIATGLASLAMKAASAAFSIGKVVAALGAVAAVTFTKKVLEMGMLEERAQAAFALMEGSVARGGQALKRAQLLARDLSLDYESTLGHMLEMRQMQFSIGEAEEFIKLTSDLRALGATAQQTEGAIMAITQIKAKGKLQAEELVKQLANAGVSTALVYEELEKVTGKSRKEVEGLMQAGKIDADTALAAIKQAIMRKANITEAGQAARHFATDTTSGLLQTLQFLPDKFFADVGRRVKNMETFRRSLRNIILFFDPNEGGGAERERLARFVEKMIKGFEVVTKLATEFGAGFGEQLEAITSAFSFDEPTAETLGFARKSGKALGKFFATIPKLASVALSAVRGFARGLGLGDLVEDGNKKLDEIDFDKLGAKVEKVTQSIGQTIRDMFDDLVSETGLTIVNDIGVRLGKALMTGVKDSIKGIFGIDEFLKEWSTFSVTDAISSGSATEALDDLNKVLHKGLNPGAYLAESLVESIAGKPDKPRVPGLRNVWDESAKTRGVGHVWPAKQRVNLARFFTFNQSRVDSPPQANFQPRPTMTRAPAVLNGGPVTIYVQGDGDHDRSSIRRQVEEGMSHALTEFAEGPLAEAAGT